MDSNWCPPEQLHLQEQVCQQVNNLDLTYVNDVTSAEIMVRAGLGIALLPDFIAQSERDLTRLIPLDFDADLQYGLVYWQDEDNQAVWDLDFMSSISDSPSLKLSKKSRKAFDLFRRW